MSGGSVITNEDGGLKRSCGSPSARCKFAVMNPERFFGSIGMPTNIRELIGRDITDAQIEEMAHKASCGGTSTLGNFLPLAKADMIAIYNLARAGRAPSRLPCHLCIQPFVLRFYAVKLLPGDRYCFLAQAFACSTCVLLPQSGDPDKERQGDEVKRAQRPTFRAPLPILAKHL